MQNSIGLMAGAEQMIRSPERARAYAAAKANLPSGVAPSALTEIKR